MTPEEVYAELYAMFDDGSDYGGLSQYAHACQAAAQAAAAGYDDLTVVAALLHDVGWKLAGAAPFKIDNAAKRKSASKTIKKLSEDNAEDLGPMDGNNVAEATNPSQDCFAAQLGILKTIIAEGASEEQQRAQHDVMGATYLRMRGFDEKVPHLVEGHVLAKRYLCFKEDGYLEKLSPGSRRTLAFQGVMTPNEASIFETDPLFKDSLAMRRWDEEAKYAGLKVPSFESYKSSIIAAISQPPKTAEETLASCSYVREGNTVVALRQ